MESTVLSFENKHDEQLPTEFRNQDIRLPRDFIQYVLDKYTQDGETILDPFAGYATTLIVAEQMNRVCYGIESDKSRFDYGQSKLKRKDLLIHGNSFELANYPISALDFVLFSPPYMHRSYDRNPLRGELYQEDCYSKYLFDLLSIARCAGKLLKEGRHLVVEASNLINDSGVTTLAWDIAGLFKTEFKFVKEKIIHWRGGYGYGYNHSYCLIFKKND